MGLTPALVILPFSYFYLRFSLSAAILVVLSVPVDIGKTEREARRGRSGSRIKGCMKREPLRRRL